MLLHSISLPIFQEVLFQLLIKVFLLRAFLRPPANFEDLSLFGFAVGVEPIFAGCHFFGFRIFLFVRYLLLKFLDSRCVVLGLVLIVWNGIQPECFTSIKA
jgi:hypothetical protein